MKTINKPVIAMAVIVGITLMPFAFAVPTLVENGNFENNSSIPWETPGWWAGGAGTSGVDARGRFCTTVTTLGTDDWGVQLRQNDIRFEQGETYKVRFKAWSSAQTTVTVGAVDESVSPAVAIFDSPSEADQLITAGLDDAEGQLISYDFVAAASTEKARFRFMMGAGIIPLNETLCLDDIVVEPPAKNILNNSGFDDNGAGWEIPGWWAGGAGSSVIDSNGRMCTTVTTQGTDDWGAQLRQVGKKLVAGRSYTVKFDAWSSADMTVVYDVIDEPAGYKLLLKNDAVTITSRLNEAPTQFSVEHNVDIDSSEANFRFLYGGGLVPAGETVCVDNVKLLDPEGNSVLQPTEPEVAAVQVNQQGYLPTLAKVATFKTILDEFTQPRAWQLLDNNAAVVATGETVVIGDDINSGDVIHEIDFSAFTSLGTDYVLQVAEGNEMISSHPFDIRTDLMTQLKYEALSYFYHNRSGIEIIESVVGDAKWARPAGHLNDNAVETFVCKDDPANELCRTADVSGGWYDAGDHGKYVVNGGISAWTLLNQYERSKNLGRNESAFGAGAMALPEEETSNAMPDILDEAKWEIEFLLRMQIPAGQPLAGMVYHKMHDDNWTGLGLAPHEDTQIRYIQAPTTAATLNLAAVAAQCARVYKSFDADFADRCLTAAKIAYQAALANPEMLAGTPAADDPNPQRFTMTNGNGGGLYGDDDVRDEFFWALAELYISTQDKHYLRALKDSPLYDRYSVEEVTTDDGVPASLYHWGNTNGLGLMSLVANSTNHRLKKKVIDSAERLIINAADSYVTWANQPGYSMPMDSTVLEWGSNSGVVNNMMVLGLANDLACAQDTKYVDAMAKGMAYLLGNNPLGKSYVTGYGENPLIQPHHRFWANAENADYPVPPPGVLSGGPNSSHATTGDPVSIARIDANCPAETCYIDNIGSWSTNEITINWNSPFAWTAAYLDEYSQLGLPSDSDCKVNNTRAGSVGLPLLFGLLLLAVGRKKLARLN